MQLSQELFLLNSRKFDFKGKEVSLECLNLDVGAQDQQKTLMGRIANVGNRRIPQYDVEGDQWYVDDVDESSGDIELEVHVHKDGTVQFSPLGEPDSDLSYHLHSHNELNDFLDFVPRATSNTLNQPVSFKTFRFEEVLSGLYLSISSGNGIDFISLREIQGRLEPELFTGLINEIFGSSMEFLVDVGNFEEFCSLKGLSAGRELAALENMPILFSGQAVTNCHSSVSKLHPYLGFGLRESFSCQYLLDYIRNSRDGIAFMKNLRAAILGKHPMKQLTIIAPSTLLGQIRYSLEFREQYEFYKVELTNASNHTSEAVVDLKMLYINRRRAAKEFVIDKMNAKFLDTVRNPLPFNLEKNYRSYQRAYTDFDRLEFAGKLFNLVLRSIVFYPLEEMICLGMDKKYAEIEGVHASIRSGERLADGSWLTFFNILAKCMGANRELKLSLFAPLVAAIEKRYRDLRSIVEARNDSAHYRESPAVFMKKLDSLLPDILTVLREALSDNLFLMIECQNQRRDGLYVTAKKIMGYEVDIETIEFKTTLEGRHFMKDELVVYNHKYDYTVPLTNFFRVEIVSSAAIKMGVLGSVANGTAEFDY